MIEYGLLFLAGLAIGTGIGVWLWAAVEESCGGSR